MLALQLSWGFAPQLSWGFAPEVCGALAGYAGGGWDPHVSVTGMVGAGDGTGTGTGSGTVTHSASHVTFCADPCLLSGTAWENAFPLTVILNGVALYLELKSFTMIITLITKKKSIRWGTARKVPSPLASLSISFSIVAKSSHASHKSPTLPLRPHPDCNLLAPQFWFLALILVWLNFLKGSHANHKKSVPKIQLLLGYNSSCLVLISRKSQKFKAFTETSAGLIKVPALVHTNYQENITRVAVLFPTNKY